MDTPLVITLLCNGDIKEFREALLRMKRKGYDIYWTVEDMINLYEEKS